MARNYGCYCPNDARLEVDGDREIVKFTRELPPAHYTIKIESFSTVLEIVKHSKRDKYECKEFEAEGHKWSLCIYPDGNKKENEGGHISLYLKLVDKLDACDVLNVSLKFFVFDQIRFKYLTISDIRERRFHAMKDEWGVPKILSQSEFENASNGFLIDDSCIFGVEAFVVSKTRIENGGTSSVRVATESELLSKLPKFGSHIWNVYNISELPKHKDSSVFTIMGYDWKLILYPQGIDCCQHDKSLSLFLCLEDLSKVPKGNLLATKFEICLKSKVGGIDLKKSSSVCFGNSTTNWGFPTFFSLKEFNHPSAGFKVNDSVTVQVTIEAVMLVQNASQKGICGSRLHILK